MSSHLEETLQRDIALIRGKVSEMAALGESALRDALQVLKTHNRQLAYSVILRDQRIDELEKEIDQLCLEFIVRQQPVAGHLRFVYASIKINSDLERIGDYAESIARQVLKLGDISPGELLPDFERLAEVSIAMFHDSMRAFLESDAALASTTMVLEEEADTLRNSINARLTQFEREGRIPVEALNPLQTIARRYERVSDQAKNLCEEVIYMCTGEYAKHKGMELCRVVFADDHNSCLSQIAEAVGNSLRQPKLSFSSGGVEPKPVDAGTLQFLKSKEVQTGGIYSKSLVKVQDLDHHQVFVALSERAEKVAPARPTKTVVLVWKIEDPANFKGTPEKFQDACQAAWSTLSSQMGDLAEAILGDKID